MRKFFLLTILCVSYSIFTNAQSKTQVLEDIRATMGDFISDLNNAGDVSENDRHQAIYNMDVTFGSPEYFMYNGKQMESLQSWLQFYFKDVLRNLNVQHTLTIKEQSLTKKDANAYSDMRWLIDCVMERSFYYQGNWVSVPSESVSLTVVWNGENKYVSIVALDGQMKQLPQVKELLSQELNKEQNNDNQSLETTLKYDSKEDYYYGLAVVKKDSKYGAVNIQGELVVPIEYDKISGFFINNNVTLSRAEKDGKWGVIDNKNNIVIPFIYETMYYYSDKLFAVEMNNKWGFIDIEGRVIIPFEYKQVWSFNNGVAIAQIDNKWGFIDKENKSVVPFIYDYASWFNDNYIKVRMDKLYYIVDTSGGKIDNKNYESFDLIDYDYEYWERYRVEVNKKYGMIDNNANVILPCEYDWIGDYNNGRIKITKDKKSGVVDINGNIIIPIIYDNLYFSDNKRIEIEMNGKWGFIDWEGKLISAPEYDDIKNGGEDLYLVKKNKKWGFVNSDNEVIISFVYEDAKRFSEDLAAVKMNGKWGFIDKNNKTVIPFIYKEAKGFNEGLAAVKKDKKWGYIDKENKTIISFIYDLAYSFGEGIADAAWVWIDDHSYFINKSGEIIKRD